MSVLAMRGIEHNRQKELLEMITRPERSTYFVSNIGTLGEASGLATGRCGLEVTKPPCNRTYIYIIRASRVRGLKSEARTLELS